MAHPSECWEALELHLHTALESGAWLPAICAFLARKPPFSAVLEKQKSAKEKTARQSEGTKLLEGVGTVPAEVASDSLLRLGEAPQAERASDLP